MGDACFSTQLIDGDGVFNVSGLDHFMKFNLVTNYQRYIWLAKAQNIEPCTLVMDLEGTDGRERGEDDTAFEKQSALFALAVSDIVLINIPRKTTLLFVIRDKSKIWDAVPKPHAHKETPLSEFFNVEVMALSSYEEKEELFKEQVSHLRERFQHSIAPGGLAGDRRVVVPASGFSFSSQQFWKVIKENKDLDLPAHKVMVATEWQQVEEAVQHDYVPGFGKKLSSLLDRCLSE
ncbi:unnamed protein product [Miscanthus lutarioriparius]|uniref:GB1/RHD3-type G domain-containing protein n=1 Tax=Miscanthus lutarioriparius TaxID=422564 RepID=A0A811Q301_9POAL|nr:unnamed protein product [Miscanthus lutarioriparius]